MDTVNALAVRKGLGQVLRNLEADGQPVLVTRDREAVAALVPIAMFRQRFVDFFAEDALNQALRDLKSLQSVSSGTDSLLALRRLREGT